MKQAAAPGIRNGCFYYDASRRRLYTYGYFSQNTGMKFTHCSQIAHYFITAYCMQKKRML